MTATVSAKIPDDLKDELDGEDINVSEVVREALADEVARRRREAFVRRAESLRESVGDGIDTDLIVRAVRETREEN